MTKLIQIFCSNEYHVAVDEEGEVYINLIKQLFPPVFLYNILNETIFNLNTFGTSRLITFNNNWRGIRVIFNEEYKAYALGTVGYEFLFNENDKLLLLMIKKLTSEYEIETLKNEAKLLLTQLKFKLITGADTSYL